ncbi:hypothetical protein EYF80_004333 [Liparis tanakae]|uniref:Uncharacterized protein n=1 Tax=Liparis tanakae TaxID=230148 RepID=A0A4Z2J5X1_9TELE|nr:hypothetical protein EYF80_004333 [Liparis tanakae]
MSVVVWWLWSLTGQRETPTHVASLPRFSLVISSLCALLLVKGIQDVLELLAQHFHQSMGHIQRQRILTGAESTGQRRKPALAHQCTAVVGQRGKDFQDSTFDDQHQVYWLVAEVQGKHGGQEKLLAGTW